jgi:hypothetical protein
MAHQVEEWSLVKVTFDRFFAVDHVASAVMLAMERVPESDVEVGVVFGHILQGPSVQGQCLRIVFPKLVLEMRVSLDGERERGVRRTLGVKTPQRPPREPRFTRPPVTHPVVVARIRDEPVQIDLDGATRGIPGRRGSLDVGPRLASKLEVYVQRQKRDGIHSHRVVGRAAQKLLPDEGGANGPVEL